MGLDRSRTSDNRVTNITINEAVGESFYKDEAGWTWIIDKFGTVIDGPFDLTGDKDPQAPKPEFPVPPPPQSSPPQSSSGTEPNEAGSPWLILLLPTFLLLKTGCAMSIGSNSTAQLFDRAELQPSLALSVGSRTHASSSAAKRDSESLSASATEGGGTLSVPRAGQSEAERENTGDTQADTEEEPLDPDPEEVDDELEDLTSEDGDSPEEDVDATE